MWREAAKPLFLLLFVCMWMTAAAELGPDQWFPKVMGDLVPQLQGVLFLVYTAGLMFLLRTFGSGIAHKNPIGTLFVCAILTGLGLYWLGGLKPGTSAVVAFAAATLFGVGKSYFWPTMIGVTAEQFPRGGALLISLMGGTGHAVGRGGAADHGIARSTSTVRARRCRWWPCVCVILDRHLRRPVHVLQSARRLSRDPARDGSSDPRRRDVARAVVRLGGGHL